MNTQLTETSSLPVSVTHSRFTGRDGAEEYHLILKPTAYADFETQLRWLQKAYEEYLGSLSLEPDSAILRRFFCSDLQNQACLLSRAAFSNPKAPDVPCSISWVNQPPIAPARVALWAYHILDPPRALTETQDQTSLSLERGRLTHRWTSGLSNPLPAGSRAQAQSIMERYVSTLAQNEMTLLDHVIRTWFFVKDVDNNYQGLVEARNEIFEQEGLTQDTHYIASTGIEGGNAHPKALVTLDAYAIHGIASEQIEFLSALDYLSPTQLYGVAFERATSVAYRDRKQVYISGTASIDWQGHIVHEGDVSQQLERTLANIAALLRQAEATLQDMAVFIVYVRDAIDQEPMRRAMAERFPRSPTIVVTAPVCRPGWLIEIEGIAMVSDTQPHLPPF